MAEGIVRKSVFRAALATVVAALIALADPMGLDNATDRHSADVVNRVSALFYGQKAPWVRNRIAVIEVTDRALNTLAREEQLSWPPPRVFYARLLGSLAAGDKRPSAVFFDYAFVSTVAAEDENSLLDTISYVTKYEVWGSEPGCQASPMAKIACIVDAGGMPVIIGKNYPPNSCIGGEHADRNPANVALTHAAVMVPIGWPKLTSQFQPVLTGESYRTALNEAGVADPCACTELHAYTDGYDVAPALAMAHAICLDKDNPGVSPICDLLPPKKGVLPKGSVLYHDISIKLVATETGKPNPVQAARTPVGPTWGSIPDEETQAIEGMIFRKTREKPECKKEKAGFVRALQVAWAQLTSGLGEGADAVAVPCPYHLTIDVDAFSDPENETLLAKVRADLNDRAVAIGAAQAMSNDWISTTLNARQAGVHYHAMTADNLLTFGADLPYEPSPVFPGELLQSFDWGDVLELACLFLIALVVELARARMAGQEDRGVWPFDVRRWRASAAGVDTYWSTARGQRMRLALVALVFMAAATVLAASVAFTIERHWAPVNVVGLAGFTILWVAYELGSHDGWGAILGLAASVTLLSSRWVRQQLKSLWPRQDSAPAAPPSDESQLSPPPENEKVKP